MKTFRMKVSLGSIGNLGWGSQLDNGDVVKHITSVEMDEYGIMIKGQCMTESEKYTHVSMKEHAIKVLREAPSTRPNHTALAEAE